MVPALKGHRATLNYVLALAGTDLTANSHQYNVQQLLED